MKAIKVLALVGTLALVLAGVYGWVMGCCPGVPACGGCHAMNWERLALVVGVVFVLLFAALYRIIDKAIQGQYGPYFMNRTEEEDQCSTTNPERDYE